MINPEKKTENHLFFYKRYINNLYECKQKKAKFKKISKLEILLVSEGPGLTL